MLAALALVSMLNPANAEEPLLPELDAVAEGEATGTDKAAAARKFVFGYLQVAPLRITTVTTNQYGAATSASSVDNWTVYKG
jgi:hypothetical protein